MSAARKLSKEGMDDFMILEGSSQVGGRIRQATLGGYTVETGCMWLQGGEGNPVYDLSEEMGVDYSDPGYDEYIVRGADGQDITEAFDEEYDAFEEGNDFLYNTTQVSRFSTLTHWHTHTHAHYHPPPPHTHPLPQLLP